MIFPKNNNNLIPIPAMVTFTDALKQVPLFSDLTDQELRMLCATGRRQNLPARNMVFQEGELGNVLLVILSGKVKVLLLGKEGQEFILAILGPGNFFGEMAIFEEAPRSATIMTVEPCEFLLIDQKDIFGLLKIQPLIAVKLLKHLSHRLRKTNEQIRSLVMFDIYGRIGRCLLNLAETQGEQTTRQYMIPNRPSFQELAKMVGCSRETLSRAMKVLKENGTVTVTKNTMFINKVLE